MIDLLKPQLVLHTVSVSVSEKTLTAPQRRGCLCSVPFRKILFCPSLHCLSLACRLSRHRHPNSVTLIRAIIHSSQEEQEKNTTTNQSRRSFHKPHITSYQVNLAKMVVESEDSAWLYCQQQGWLWQPQHQHWHCRQLLSSCRDVMCLIFLLSLLNRREIILLRRRGIRVIPAKNARDQDGEFFMVLRSPKIRDNARWHRQNDLRWALLFGFIAH
jgi:hypothetical protein